MEIIGTKQNKVDIFLELFYNEWTYTKVLFQ